MFTWNSTQYLKFSTERTLPAIDLAKRIHTTKPNFILDVGCGPGNSSKVLKDAFPNAQITGIDYSKDMINTAQTTYSDIHFEQWDANAFADTCKQSFDIIFSNACLQWIPDHLTTIKKLSKLLNPDGIMAVQIPCNFNEPIHLLMEETVSTKKWAKHIPARRIFHVYDLSTYYNCISSLSDNIEIWTTTYHHIMPSHEAILEWYEGTGLRPYLSQLDTYKQEEFKQDILHEIKQKYPFENDGKILFPFPRLFFTFRK